MTELQYSYGGFVTYQKVDETISVSLKRGEYT